MDLTIPDNHFLTSDCLHFDLSAYPMRLQGGCDPGCLSWRQQLALVSWINCSGDKGRHSKALKPLA